jgi:LPXTG-motif cell wall-anchored protein
MPYVAEETSAEAMWPPDCGRAALASGGEDMNTSTKKRIARLSGLLLLSLLVVALAASAAQAMLVSSTGSGGSAGSGTSQPLQVPTLALHQGAATSSAAQLVSTGTSSTAWIAIGAAAAALLVALVGWTMIRRRRQASEPESQAYCALHPGDSLCAG